MFQIHKVRCGIEDRLKMVQEASTIQLDRPENLERVSLSCCRYLGLGTYPRPRAIEGGILPEARFVFEEDSRSFALGFFLRLGYS